MATGWAGDGAVQDQIDATVKDAIKRARQQLPKGPSLERCEECEAPIPEARRQALPGYWLSIERSGGIEWLVFLPDPDNRPRSDLSTDPVEEPVDGLGMGSVDRPHDPRGITRRSIGGSPAPIARKTTPPSGFGPKRASDAPVGLRVPSGTRRAKQARQPSRFEPERAWRKF